MTLSQIIFGILLLIVVLALLFMFSRMRRFLAKHMALFMGGTFIAGFVIYMIGFWYGASENLVTITLRSAVASFEMFASHNELIEINEELKEGSVLYMLCFSAVHIIAISLTLLFVLDLFGKRFISVIESWNLSHMTSRLNVYLIDGTDDNCIALAKSLPESDDRMVIFVKSTVDTTVHHLSLFDVFLSGIKRDKSAALCEDLGVVIHTSLPFSTSLSEDKGRISANLTKALIRAKHAEVFFISEESGANALGAYSLQQVVGTDSDIKIFAGINLSATYAVKLQSCPNVKAVTRSALVVRDLCESTPLMTDGAGKRTLVIGFGHTGSRCVEMLVKAGFKSVDIVNKDVSTRSEEFLCFHPELRDSGVRIFNVDPKSNAFWSYIYENMPGLSNILVFGQDQKATFTLAVKLLRYRESLGTPMDDFRVYMMVHETQHCEDMPHLYPFGKREAIYNYKLF